ncbi:MAG: hypothetical protein H6700_02925 [Myxococcales bacterium]|nr:hypothetical protein [Myxococcales bacterium]
MNHTRAGLSLALVLALAGCGDEETFDFDAGTSGDTATGDTTADAGADDGSGAGDASDTSDDVAADTGGPDTTPDLGPDAPPARSVTFVLANANPGGLSRWVQLANPLGIPTWYRVLEAGSLDSYIRIQNSCTVCECSTPNCTPCDPEAEILELAPGEEIRSTWTGTFYTIDPVDFCAEPGPVEGDTFTVEFEWSPEPPGEDGTLPVGTLSNTRASFTLTEEGSETRYDIEQLAP